MCKACYIEYFDTMARKKDLEKTRDELEGEVKNWRTATIVAGGLLLIAVGWIIVKMR